MLDETGWINKVITAGIIAMIGWTLMSVQNMSVSLAVLTTQVAHITEQLQDQPDIIDIISIKQRIDNHDIWLGRLSDRLNEVEDRLTAGEAKDRSAN